MPPLEGQEPDPVRWLDRSGRSLRWSWSRDAGGGQRSDRPSIARPSGNVLCAHREERGGTGLSVEPHFLAQFPQPLNLRQQELLPIVGAVKLARPQFCGHAVAPAVEHRQRVMADGCLVRVEGALFLLAVDRNLGRVHAQRCMRGPLLSFGPCNQFPVHGGKPAAVRSPYLPSR